MSYPFELYGRDGTVAPVALSTKDAARFLNKSPRTLEDWRLKGFGPRFQKWGRSVRYRLIDLAAFLDQPTYQNTGEALAA